MEEFNSKDSVCGNGAPVLPRQGQTVGRKACDISVEVYGAYRAGQFTPLNSTDGSLCKEIWFNNKQLCIYASSASEVATPAETLTANL